MSLILFVAFFVCIVTETSMKELGVDFFIVWALFSIADALWIGAWFKK